MPVVTTPCVSHPSKLMSLQRSRLGLREIKACGGLRRKQPRLRGGWEDACACPASHRSQASCSHHPYGGLTRRIRPLTADGTRRSWHPSAETVYVHGTPRNRSARRQPLSRPQISELHEKGPQRRQVLLPEGAEVALELP